MSECRLLSWRVDLGVSDLGVCCPRVRLPSCWGTHSFLGIAQCREGTSLSGVISSVGGPAGAAGKVCPGDLVLERAVLKVETRCTPLPRSLAFRLKF